MQQSAEETAEQVIIETDRNIEKRTSLDIKITDSLVTEFQIITVPESRPEN